MASSSPNPKHLQTPHLPPHPSVHTHSNLSRKFRAYTTIRDSDMDEQAAAVGEDSVVFDFSKQKISSWLYFTAVLGTVLFVLNVAWIDNSTGFGKPFVDAVSQLSASPEVYFINHWYNGVQLWHLKEIFGVPELLVGQVIWCLAHTVWIGNSVSVAASIGLIGHHLFGAWNGDRRLATRYGESFEAVKKRTSILPFAAIIDGRQKLPTDYYKEFIYLVAILCDHCFDVWCVLWTSHYAGS